MEKIAFRTCKEVGRSVSYINLCSKHVFLEAVKCNGLISLTWTRLLGPGLGRGTLDQDLDAAFFPGLGCGFLGLDVEAFRTGKEVRRSVSYILLCSKHVFLDAVKFSDLT
jgi:hypothetical protein